MQMLSGLSDLVLYTGSGILYLSFSAFKLACFIKCCKMVVNTVRWTVWCLHKCVLPFSGAQHYAYNVLRKIYDWSPLNKCLVNE